MKLSLHARIYGLVVLSIAAVGLLYVVAFYSNHRTAVAVETASADRIQLETVNQYRRAVQQAALAAMDAIVDRDSGQVDPELVEEVKSSRGVLNNGSLSTDLGARDGAELESRLEAIFTAIEGELFPLVRGTRSPRVDREADIAELDDRIDELAGEIEEILGRATSGIAERTAKAETKLLQTLQMSNFVALGGFLASTLLVAVTGYLLARSILRRLRTLGGGLGETQTRLRGMAGQSRNNGEALANAASEQAATLEEISSSITQLSSIAQQNAQQSDRASESMNDVLKIIEVTNGAMSGLVADMREIERASEETSKIVKAIDEIAFQTNLLALNAAVEAARAGEAGAGFAVVADEVRNLAMRAAGAARETGQLIEETVAKVKGGVGTVENTHASFAKADTQVRGIGSLFGEIASASREQSSGLNQITSAVNDMDRTVQENAARAEEGASLVTEMDDQARVLAAKVAELGEFVGMLKSTGASARVARPKPSSRSADMSEDFLPPPQRARGAQPTGVFRM